MLLKVRVRLDVSVFFEDLENMRNLKKEKLREIKERDVWDQLFNSSTLQFQFFDSKNQHPEHVNLKQLRRRRRQRKYTNMLLPTYFDPSSISITLPQHNPTCLSYFTIFYKKRERERRIMKNLKNWNRIRSYRRHK